MKVRLQPTQRALLNEISQASAQDGGMLLDMLRGQAADVSRGLLNAGLVETCTLEIKERRALAFRTTEAGHAALVRR